MTADKERIESVYRKYRERIITVRHILHARPETGDEEHETTAYLCSLMEDLGLRVDRPLPTGLVAVLDVPEPEGRCVGLRADIDSGRVRSGILFEKAGSHACLWA